MLPDFKTQIKNIRKEAIELGFSISTMDSYEKIWKQFIYWKKQEYFFYNEKEYIDFLLCHYQFDVTNYTKKSKSRHQMLMRSKRILDDFESYKECMSKRILPTSLYCEYPKEWNPIVNNYLKDCEEAKGNAQSSVKTKRDYITRLLSYFHQTGLNNLSDFNRKTVVTFINKTIEKGNISKRRNFYILRDFLNYLFIEGFLLEDLSIYIPKIKSSRRKKIPTFIKQEKIEELLESIPRERDIEYRDYCILLIAARLGLRISDILNIKFKDIDWKNYKINVTQPKTKNLNTLPLSKEVGWSIVNYIKIRPKCSNDYLFIKFKHPYEKMEHFYNFKKYFEEEDKEIDNNQKKGIHNLRNSLAKNMLDSEIPLPIISSVLGHSNLDTTVNSYLKIDLKHLETCSLEVDE